MMKKAFLAHLTPLLQFTERLGLTYIAHHETTNAAKRIMNRTVHIIAVVFYIYTIYEYVTSIYLMNKGFSEVTKIGDIITATFSVYCTFSKWIYYYYAQRKLQEIILKVSQFQFKLKL